MLLEWGEPHRYRLYINLFRTSCSHLCTPCVVMDKLFDLKVKHRDI